MDEDAFGFSDQLLEDIRTKLFEAGEGRSILAGDGRAQTIFERLAERLQEEPDEVDNLEAKSFARIRRPSVLTRQWKQYVASCMASIDKRAESTDENGQRRVSRIYRSYGNLRRIDLADWRGRPRVRILFDSAGSPTEVTLISLSRQEVHYTRESFDPEGPDVSDGLGNTLDDCFERARRSSVLSLGDPSPKHRKMTEVNVENLCDQIFPRLERLLKREQVEGRQLVPCSEELYEMSLEQILEHLEKASQV